MNEQIFSNAFSTLKQLAEDFQANEQSYFDAKYSEAQARLDFIDKFWIALGWDVGHEREKNPYEQEVKVERGVAVSNRTKKADYAFFAAPNFRDVKFYVEAKKPSRNLDNADDYFQTIRYGWSSNTPLAVLTDFEQFRIIDCRYKPNIATAENFALKKFSYKEYADEEKFREIYHLFSRESVFGGSLEDFAKNLPKRGKGAKQGEPFAIGIQKSVDESFLDDLDSYRDELARAFKNKNAELDGEDLTEAVTRTLDRLVFIRFLEDKLIEPDTMMDKFDSWADFVRASSRLNGFYNSIIFKSHFIDSKDFNAGEKVFTDICGELSHKDSPYNFNYIPVHILGSIYERFLGKVIVATDLRATVQEKPEVRKAGGVYYTPEYIVRYIVENTIGKLIENKTPEEISKMRFADIACGSGSFLLGFYDLLLRYHTTYYNLAGKKGEARTAGCLENPDGSFTLTIAQRREILRNNVFGVDVDAQATEVAQLSLALKLLEDATTATARAFQPRLGERILPDMTKNIVCGNSLIDHDILDGQLFERNEERKLNPMSYEDKFPEIMRRGGFDAIVGNPPYIQLSMEEFKNEVANNYIKQRYGLSGGRLNTFAFFFEQARQVTNDKGKISFIVPNTILSQEYYEELRTRLLKKTLIEGITNPQGQIFKGAVVETTVLVLTNLRKQQETNTHKVEFSDIFIEGELKKHSSVEQSILESNYKKSFLIPSNPELLTFRNRLIAENSKFGDWFNINQAIALKHDRAACLTQIKETDEYREMLDGRNINRYFTGTSSNYFKFDVSKIHSCKREDIFLQSEKILFRRVGENLIASLDTNQKFALNTLVVITPKILAEYNLRYTLGLFNSKLLNFYYLNFLKSSKKVFSEIQARQVEQLPFCAINFDESGEKAAHDKMVSLVDGMLDAKKHLQAAQTDKDKTFYQDRCNALDRQIDKLVYDLYALTPEEIAIVEGKA